jgi:ankyrin repeat protein
VLAKISGVFPLRFEFNQTRLKPPLDLAVNQYVAVFKDPRCALVKAEIAGHADFFGPRLYNQALSEWRAQTVVSILVASGVDVNCTDQHGMGPLLTFTPSIIAYLLSQGANPNRQKNENGTPVLNGIAYMIQVECVRLLLEGGADANEHHAQSDEKTGRAHEPLDSARSLRASSCSRSAKFKNR